MRQQGLPSLHGGSLGLGGPQAPAAVGRLRRAAVLGADLHREEAEEPAAVV